MKNIFILALMSLALSSCIKLSSFDVKGTPKVSIGKVSLLNLQTEIEIALDVENSSRRVTILEYELEVKDPSGKTMLTLSSNDKVLVKRGDNHIEAVVDANISPAIMKYFLGGSLQNDIENFYIDGYVVGRATVKKRLEIKNYKLKNIGFIKDLKLGNGILGNIL